MGELREEYAKCLNELDCFEAAKLGMGYSNLRAVKPEKFYVYALAYPDTGKVFYVGKGKGARWRSHECDSRNLTHINDRVQDAINSVERSGALCTAICVRDGLTENQAFNLEAYLISSVDGLFNGAKGRMTPTEKEYACFKRWPRVTRLHLYMPDGRKTWLHKECKNVLRIKRKGLVEWGRAVAAERLAA